MADTPTDRDDAEFADDDNLEGLADYPPEQPLGVDERLTPVEEQAGERFDRTIAHREQPDRPEHDRDPGRVGALVAPGDTDVDALDDEKDEVAWEMREV